MARSDGPAVVAFITAYTLAHGYAPTVRDVAEAFGWTSPSTAHVTLSEMRSAGLVDWVEGQRRTLHVIR